MIDYINSCDHILYQCIVDTLLSDVLKPIPGNTAGTHRLLHRLWSHCSTGTLTQAIRNFAKGLEGWLTNSLQGYPRPFVQLKVSTVVAFSQTLRRYTSLNHLAQAARAVLQNSSQVSQMLNDLNRVDFGNVQVSTLKILNGHGLICTPYNSALTRYLILCRSRLIGYVSVRRALCHRLRGTLNRLFKERCNHKANV